MAGGNSSGHAPPTRPREDKTRKRKRNGGAPTGAGGRPRRLAVNAVKSRIRDLDRQLLGLGPRAAALPANVRVNHERELVALRAQLDDNARDARRRRRIKRYHMVRFFERKKAAKLLKRAEKEREEGKASGAPEEVMKRLEEAVERARVDLNYAMYSPLEWKYCALWPKAKNEDGDQGDANDEHVAENEEGDKTEKHVGDVQHSTVDEPVTKGDPVMWERVRKATEEGQKALEKLRDSTTSTVSIIGNVSQKPQLRQSKEPKSSQKPEPSSGRRNDNGIRKVGLDLTDGQHRGKRSQGDQDDEESDGGFFE